MDKLTEQEIGAFVGPRAGYYLGKWWSALESGSNAGNTTGFNWAAFLLSGLWLPYRKMYRATATFFGFVLLEMIFEDVVYVSILGRPEAPGSLGSALGMIAGFICGGFGNAWYLSHTQKTVAEVRSQGLEEEACLQELARRGGTSMASAFGALVGFFVVAFISFLLLEVLRR